MTFEEHLENYSNGDGTYDLNAAEAARAKELADDPNQIGKLALKAARQERSTWESRNRALLAKQFSQPALSAELEAGIKVPIGDSTVVDYGQMNHDRIRLRKDLRTKVHLNELRAFDAEMTHWLQTEALLGDGETISEATGRLP